MYSKLKQVMKSKGYEVSEGGDWAASDTPQFTAFAKFVLGAQHVSPNQVLAYPQAFPGLMESLQAVSEGEIDPPAAAVGTESVLTPEDTAEAAPIDPPAVAGPIDPPAEDAAPLNVSGDVADDTPAGETPEGEAAGDEGTPSEDAPQE